MEDRTLENTCYILDDMKKGKHFSQSNVMEAHVFEWHKTLRLLYGASHINPLDNKPNSVFIQQLKNLQQAINNFLITNGEYK